jgi:hypothetical protein
MDNELKKESLKLSWAIMWRWTVLTVILLLPMFYLRSFPHSIEDNTVYSVIETVITFIAFYFVIKRVLLKGYGNSIIVISNNENT